MFPTLLSYVCSTSEALKVLPVREVNTITGMQVQHIYYTVVIHDREGEELIRHNSTIHMKSLLKSVGDDIAPIHELPPAQDSQLVNHGLYHSLEMQ